MKIEAVKAILSDLAARAAAAPMSLPADTEAALRSLVAMLSGIVTDEMEDVRITNKNDDLGSLVMKLAELSRFGKQEWVDLSMSYGIKLDLNPRDSARDVMGKLARYLRDHPDALKKVSRPPASPATQAKSSKKKRKLAESLQDTLIRLLDE